LKCPLISLFSYDLCCSGRTLGLLHQGTNTCLQVFEHRLLQWEDAVLVDAKRLLEIRNWKTAARNREEWRKKCGEARARFGL
jgi:hypothetical protein